MDYNHQKQNRGSEGVSAVVAEINADNLSVENDITYTLPMADGALTWDTLSWSQNSGSTDSWHLNGELHMCTVTLNLEL